MNYIQVKNEMGDIKILTPLWISYIREIYTGDPEVESASDNEIAEWLTGRVKIQGQRESMHFELIYEKDHLIGFAMYAIDLGGIKGILEAGCGYIMEFYIVPDYRRKGMGSQVYRHMEKTLKTDGARKIYLTPDSVNGVPFWKALGFTDSGKSDPDNKIHIYIKEIENKNDHVQKTV